MPTPQDITARKDILATVTDEITNDIIQLINTKLETRFPNATAERITGFPFIVENLVIHALRATGGSHNPTPTLALADLLDQAIAHGVVAAETVRTRLQQKKD